ncbi:MAG: DUF4351 domain-containing protein [Okeania sp. SIO2H7]|nr:DUF4351 domain-containing protein [Okeania sp. SIO2H7]
MVGSAKLNWKLRNPVFDKSRVSGLRINISLRFDKTLIRQLFREELMQESVIYQDILQKGEIRGELRGEIRGEKRGLERGKRSLISTILTCRFGTLPDNIGEKIQSLSIPQIEELSRELFNFSTVEDLGNWLDRQS